MNMQLIINNTHIRKLYTKYYLIKLIVQNYTLMYLTHYNLHPVGRRDTTQRNEPMRPHPYSRQFSKGFRWLDLLFLCRIVFRLADRNGPSVNVC